MWEKLFCHHYINCHYINPLSANPTKWPNTFKQFVGKLTPNCLSVFDHFVKLALEGLKKGSTFKLESSDREFILKSNFHGEIPNLCLIYDGCKEQ